MLQAIAMGSHGYYQDECVQGRLELLQKFDYEVGQAEAVEDVVPRLVRGPEDSLVPQAADSGPR